MAIANSASVGRKGNGADPSSEPPAIKGFGAVVLRVMAEDLAVRPKIEFASSGVCYELKGPLQAVTKLH